MKIETVLFLIYVFSIFIWEVSGALFGSFRSRAALRKACGFFLVFIWALRQISHKNRQECKMFQFSFSAVWNPIRLIRESWASWKTRTIFSEFFSNFTTVSIIEKLYFTIYSLFLQRYLWIQNLVRKPALLTLLLYITCPGATIGSFDACNARRRSERRDVWRVQTIFKNWWKFHEWPLLPFCTRALKLFDHRHCTSYPGLQ